MFEDVDDNTPMDLCHGERKSSTIDDLVPPPFVQTDPSGRNCHKMLASTLKVVLATANARITLVEDLCRRANEEIYMLKSAQRDAAQNFSHAHARINELQRELDETAKSLETQNSLLDDYINDRVVPSDVIQREYLYSETRNPAMHEWMKNVALLKTDDKDVWLAIDEIIEHWVRKWKACAPSSSKKAHNFGEALAADIDDLKEKLDFLLRQLTPNKQERSWTNLEHFIQKLTTFFDHHGTCRGDGNDTELKSYYGSEVIDSSKGFICAFYMIVLLQNKVFIFIFYLLMRSILQ
jgi:hypothetical protein